MFILLPFFVFSTVLKCSIFQYTHCKSWEENSMHVYKLRFLALLLWFVCSCSTLTYFSLSLYKGKGSWLVIDAAEVFKSDRLKALYIMGWPDGWVRVQGWSLSIQSKAWSILTMLTCRTLTWWADFFPHALILTPTCSCSSKWPHQPHLAAASPVLWNLLKKKKKKLEVSIIIRHLEQQLINCVSNSFSPSFEVAGGCRSKDFPFSFVLLVSQSGTSFPLIRKLSWLFEKEKKREKRNSRLELT